MFLVTRTTVNLLHILNKKYAFFHVQQTVTRTHYQKIHIHARFPSCGAHYHAWFDLLFRTPIHYFHDFRCFSVQTFGSGNSCLVCVLTSSSSMPSRCCIHWIFRAVIHWSSIPDPTSPVSISWAQSDENVAVMRGFASICATLNVLNRSFSHQKNYFFRV